MRDFDEYTITRAVVDRVGDVADPRLKRIMRSLINHLHEFVRDVELTSDEWSVAIDFLTRTGQKCSETRQEFILLSDTLGVSMLVDAINHRMPAGATETTVLGPFYVEDPPERQLGADVAGDVEGQPLFVEGRVLSVGGSALASAIVDIWQADSGGLYDVQKQKLPATSLRARFRTDANGRFYFWSIVPTFYPVPDDGPVGEMLRATNRHPFRPAHVHFMIDAPGYEKLVTHVFRAGDAYLDSDAVFGVKQSLIRDFVEEAPGVGPDGRRLDRSWRKLSFDFALKPTQAAYERGREPANQA
jgi:hydroxyquinol 1,2-dioxygenase